MVCTSRFRGMGDVEIPDFLLFKSLPFVEQATCLAFVSNVNCEERCGWEILVSPQPLRRGKLSQDFLGGVGISPPPGAVLFCV